MENNGGGGNRNRNPQYGSEDRSESLRDFLRVKEEDNAVTQYNNRRSNSLAGLTLNAVLSDKGPRSAVQQRTLLDIIRDDHTVPKESKRSWKAFRDKLRLRRAGSAWTSSVPIPTSDIPIAQPRSMSMNNRMSMTRRNSTRFPNAANADETDGVPARSLSSMSSSRSMLLRRNTSRIPERQMSRINIPSEDDEPADEPEEVGEAHGDEDGEEDDEGEEGGGEGVGESGGGGEPPVRMSLMALLAETGNGGYLDEEEDEEEEEEEESGREGGGGGAGGGGEYNNCCVCMVRHKGAAFIPCGHTFCRLCSRELWVQRGNCPLCNNFILEILDIF